MHSPDGQDVDGVSDEAGRGYGQDDDGNKLVDDVTGWDWVDGDGHHGGEPRGPSTEIRREPGMVWIDTYMPTASG